MGTTWSVKLVAPPTADAQALTAMAQRELDSVVGADEPVGAAVGPVALQPRRPRQLDALPPAFAQVLRCALEIAEATDGAFDPTLGALVDLWGFGPAPSPARRRKPRTVAKAREAAGWRRLTLDGDSLFQPGGLRLDLNGIAKGFAVDQVAAALDRPARARTSSRSGASCAARGPSPTASPGGSSWSARPRPMTARAPWSPCTACRSPPRATTAGSSSMTAAATPTHPRDRVAVNIAHLARQGSGERHGDDAAGPGETSGQVLVHRTASCLGSGAAAPRSNEWTKPSSASSSTESFR
jgi:hypothetical protein